MVKIRIKYAISCYQEELLQGTILTRICIRHTRWHQRLLETRKGELLAMIFKIRFNNNSPHIHAHILTYAYTHTWYKFIWTENVN